jgi:hypothetical protein
MGFILACSYVLDVNSVVYQLADVMFDKFVSVSLTLQQSLDPQNIVPTHSIVRTRLIDIINQCLESPHDISDIRCMYSAHSRLCVHVL